MRAKHFLPTLFLMGLMVACSYNELPVELPLLEVAEEESLNVETRAETYDGKALDQEYFVTAADLENYVRYRRGTSKRSTFSVKEVKSYGFDSSQTLFYILNFDKGWEVVAADKRVQASLAYGDSGEFTMDCDNEPMKFWMNMLADGVLQTRLNKDVDTSSFSAAEKSDLEERRKANVDFWNFVSSHSPATRGDVIIPIWGPHLPPPDSLGGELVMRRYYIPNGVVTDDSFSIQGTQVETLWGQESPWNWYCPFAPNTTTLCPAGCTAVAAAQLLYHLRMDDGWEITAPEEVVCDNNNVPSFNSHSYDVWNDMALTASDNWNDCLMSAQLISYVGDICNMDYALEGSGASFEDLQNGLEEKYNITSSILDYNSSTIFSELSFYPVMVGGFRDILHDNGHSWLIDEYRYLSTVRKRYYIETFLELTAADLAQMTIEDATGYSTEYSSSSHFHMNWGYDGDNNGYYGLGPEEWQYPGRNPYKYYVQLLCNLNLEN